MRTFLSAVNKFLQDEDGITAIEYGLIAAAMATAITVAFPLVSTALKDFFTELAEMLKVTPAPATP